MFRSILITTALLAAPAFTASASADGQLKACQAMAATLAPKQAEIGEMKEKRDALAVVVETTGEAWQDAEVHRLVSPAMAQEATKAEATYGAKKRELVQIEAGMQSALAQFNRDVADYNAVCASKK